jgi:hypothetical protein
VLDAGQFRHDLPSYAVLGQSSIVSKPVNVIYLTNAEAYSITHGLFYLSDFGSRPVVGLSQSQREHMEWVVDRILGMYIRAGNWDLVSELLVSCHCLGSTGSDTYALSWRALCGAQWPCGAVPGPYYKAEKANSLTGAKNREYVFEQCYHTTLVTALAGALCEYIPEPPLEELSEGGGPELENMA